MERPDLDRLILGWRGPLLAALVALLAGLPGLLMTPVLDRTEARTVQVSARMLDRGDWVDTRYDKEDRLRTAAGLHWLQAASTAAFSDVEDRDIRPYRLPSLLGAMLAAWACAWGASALFGAGATLGRRFQFWAEADSVVNDAIGALHGAVPDGPAVVVSIGTGAATGARG